MYVYKKVIIGQLANGLPVLGFKLLEKISNIDIGLDIAHYTDEYFRNFFSIRKINENEMQDNYVYLYGKNNDVDEYFILLDSEDNPIPFKELDNLPTVELLSYFGEQLGFMVLFNLEVCVNKYL